MILAAEPGLAGARGFGIPLVAYDCIVSKVGYETAGEVSPQETAGGCPVPGIVSAFWRICRLECAEGLLIRLLQPGCRAEAELPFYVKPVLA